MFKVATKKAALRAAVSALLSASVAGAGLYVIAWLFEGTPELGGRALDGWWWASVVAAALAGGLAAAHAVRRALDHAQRELALAQQLALKHAELEQRLTERALLFDVLRESTESHDLDRVLDTLVERIGPTMRLSQLAVLLHSGERTLEVRAAWGFADDVVGTMISQRRGPWSVDRGTLIVPDLSRAPQAAGFWAALPLEGSLAVLPIAKTSEQIGLLVLTRSIDEPLTEQEARYLEALADQAALAIHNAQLVARLEALATHDELTGLPNRRLFHRRLDRTILLADRYDRPLSVLALDIDHFKKLNDRCGHPAGDAALVEVARVLVESLREVDTAARVGGEEVWVLLPETDNVGALDTAEKLRTQIASLDVEGATGQPMGHLSVSIGVATRRADEGAALLLGRADAALYAAKRDGRDRVAA